MLENKGLVFKVGLVILVVVIGVGALVGFFGNLALTKAPNTNNYGTYASNPGVETPFGSLAQVASVTTNTGGFNGPQNIGLSSITTAYTVSESTTAPTYTGDGKSSSQGSNVQQQQQQNQSGSGSIEFFSNVTLNVSSPSNALNKANAIAYAFGGYVAFSSYNNQSATAVLRIPAPNYASALGQIESIGNLTSLQSSSNDVSVQYTDLNATLQSLFTEESSLLKLENQSASLNATLTIESQIQGLNAEINSIESQILQTRLLISYSTITTTFNEAGVASSPLSVKLAATPQGGTVPLGVTFTAIVNGGSSPYIVYFNFGDGSSYEGSSVIHTFYSAGTFNVTATVTDSQGNAKEVWTAVHVTPSPTPAYQAFLSYVGGLFVSVLEGIIEVAAVVIPISLVVAAVIFPLRSRLRGSNSKHGEQTNTASR
jgi:hypothetical protein